jgi:hypothetical protein
LAGVNYLIPAGSFEQVPSNYTLLKIPIGVAWDIFPDLLCYAEYQFDKGKDFNGLTGSDILSIGLNYNFNFGFKKFPGHKNGF